MFGMAMDSAKLFFAGKLFQDTSKVLKQLGIGVFLGAIIIVIAGQFLPIWISAAIGGLVSGVLQPILFKDLKYA